MTTTGLVLILGPECCADLPAAEGYIGVTVEHPAGDDGTQHEIDLYWAPPPSRRLITLTSFAPLTIAGHIVCPCGWSGDVTDGVVVSGS